MVARESTKLKEKAGGLGLVDIGDFWRAFKFSWIRRLIKTDAFWPRILELHIFDLTGENSCVKDILEYGASKFGALGKKLMNPFWKEVFISTKTVLHGSIYSAPEKLLLTPLWENPEITRNNKPIPTTAFETLVQHIQIIGHLFKHGTNVMMSRQELEQTYNLVVEEESYVELRYIINSAFIKLNMKVQDIPTVLYPMQTLLVNTANLTTKGCNRYYNLLRIAKPSKNTLLIRQTKWHEELGLNYSTDFWGKTYQALPLIKYDNRLKWLQFQIVRNCLFTNYRVSKFKPDISPLCSYCKVENEIISHLYFLCPVTFTFLKQAQAYFQELGVSITLNISTILFGNKTEKFNSLDNQIILWLKSFIWSNKFKHSHLSITVFKEVFKNRLQEVKEITNFYQNCSKIFECWAPIYNKINADNGDI